MPSNTEIKNTQNLTPSCLVAADGELLGYQAFVAVVYSVIIKSTTLNISIILLCLVGY